MKKLTFCASCVAALIAAGLICFYRQNPVVPHCPPRTIEQVKEKLKTPGFDINARYLVNGEEETLLYMAAKQNDLNMVKFLIANGARIEWNEGMYLYHPLHATTDLGIVEFFIQNGVDIETSCGMACVTLLHKAAAQGDLELAQLCFEHNANPNPRLGNGDNVTPLMAACQSLKAPNADQSWWGAERKHARQYFEVIKLLIKNGADIEAFSCHLETALDFARYSGAKEVVEFLQKELLKKRPYPYTLQELKQKVTDPHFAINAEIGSKWDRFSRTFLALAAYNDDLPYVEFLVSHGAIRKDDAPLEAAARNGNPEIMKLLLKAPIEAGKDSDFWVMSPLGIACMHCKAGDSRHLELIKLLVNSGANLNDSGCFGRSPLSLLVLCHLEPMKDDPQLYTWKGNIDAVEFLLEHGAKVGIESALSFKEKLFEYGTVMNIVQKLSLKTSEERKLKDLLEKYLKING
ncbi:MAG: ankyrin repeat domain-containing protein [Holosporales bacterium]|nr:ankyrin repeat domain-containing protein [Holosporales bacterium]